MNPADVAHREQMLTYLGQAARHFEVTLVGEPIFGWHDRTIGNRTADDRWLRVSWSQTEWTDADWWTGNQDAATITGVPKPTIFGMFEWTVRDKWGEYKNRAEIMSLVEDQPCATTPELVAELDLPDQWWGSLRNGLDNLAEHETHRGDTDQDDVTNHLLAFFGSGFDTTVNRWTTAHGDLNWTNLTAPTLVILDWEAWGRRVAGYDAAALYVLSLLAPATREMVHDTFADILDTHDGRIAQLLAVVRYLKRVEHGDFRNLVDALHDHARGVIAALKAEA